MAAETRVIKRYANRKLYDTQRSRYVTLDQIAEMIRSGEDVKIVDNNSKEDLTSVTLAQIIFEEEKKQKSFLPLSAMRSIIQSGGEAIQEAGARVRSVFSRGRDRGEKTDGVDEGVGGGSGAGGAGAGGSAAGDGRNPFKEFLAESQRTFDEWQKRVDERVRAVVESISPFAALQKEVSQLSARLGELEKRLEELAKES
ncbi:MAG TPA: polyhydroxyalkanoate synthesis regulator DNA-binding domain-containing protein [Polyangia bacterium]|nr:polyhydroxyalkanoate synthesis regulator DNA-binding domain-containing protein [Polyangia bacterium]